MQRTLTIIAVLVLCFAVVAMAEAPKYKYIGAAKCKMCHGASRGDQFAKWKDSKHSGAIAVLSTDAAKAIATKKGIADAAKAPECLKCHLTGAGMAADCFENPITDEGVGCEVCHGPGSEYKAMATMKDPVKAKAAGLLKDKDICAKKCHNSESPTFKAFDITKAWPLIAHPLKK